MRSGVSDRDEIFREITKEEYDHWRYTYPKVKAERTRDELDRLRGINKTNSAENK